MRGPGGSRGGRTGEEHGLDGRLLWRLTGYLKPHWQGAAWALLMIVGAAGLETAVPLVTRHAIDVNLPAKDLDGLLRSLLAFLGFSLGAFLLRYGQQLVTGWIGQSIVLELRQRLFQRVLRLHPGWFDRHPVGQVMSRLTNDVESLNELFTGGMILIFQDLLLLAAIAGVLLWMDWRLALVLFTVVPLIFLASFQFKRLTRAAFRRVRSLVGEVTGFLQETITGISVVQLFRREAATRLRFGRMNDDLMRENVRTIFYFAVFFPLMELLGSVATAAILWAAAGRMLEGTLSFGALVAFLAYADRFFRPIRDLAEKYNILQSAMAASERVFELLDEPTTLLSGAVGGVGGPPAPPRRGEIVLEQVWFAYEGENWVLRDVSLRIPAGGSAALVGYTGAGKSSVAGLLLRFYEFQRGRILVDGVDIREWDLQALRSRMAIVLQDVFLFSGSLADNILLGRDLPEGALEEAAARTGLDTLIAGRELGYDSPVGERGQLLSGGQRQLVSFSRALAGDPALLILDEATSSVDSVSEGLIQQAIAELMKGRSSLVIAHRLSTIRGAGRIFVLHQGRLVEEGAHDELLALGGVYQRLWLLEQPVEAVAHGA
ncbi:MAG: ABC transporter ATP-binding protein [Candidatus Delongbacteria bacterium]